MLILAGVGRTVESRPVEASPDRLIDLMNPLPSP
jgi:hypothetical protein